MRILRIAHASLTPQLRERERALVRSFPEVELQVITTTKWREAEIDVEAAPDDLFPLIKARPHLSRHIQLFAYDPKPIIKALRRHQPEIIDLNSEPYSVSCAEVLTLRNWFAPHAHVVLQTNQNIFHRYPPPFCWLERRALKEAAAVYCCSETVRELIRAKGFKKAASVIPFGVNLESYSPRDEVKAQKTEGPTIGFVGRMLPAKGLKILAAALAKLSHEGWTLLIVGDGPERRGFEQKLAEFNLLDRAKFTGAVPYSEMPQFFREMDVLVLPTQTTARVREQFGRVIVEGMASGVAVIGSTCGAIPEVIADAGLVVPEGDAEALAGALRQLISDEALRRRLARAGRIRAEQNYSWDSVANGMYELFHQVLRGSAASDLSRRVEVTA